MSSYFITGTGTGIGKTFTTCAMLHAVPSFTGYKPVISGFVGEDTDTHQFIRAMGRGTIEGISPWRFLAPLSPDMAAAREQRTVPYEELVVWTHGRGDHALIEGVGGVMVPLDAEHTTRDWMRALKLPVILVAGHYLGSMSHTLTALEALRDARLTIRAVVVNESEGSPVPFLETCERLRNHTDALIVPQPRVSSYREAYAIHALAKELA